MNALLLSCLFVFNLWGMEQEKEALQLPTEPQKIGPLTFKPYRIDEHLLVNENKHFDENYKKFLNFLIHQAPLSEISTKKTAGIIAAIYKMRPQIELSGEDSNQADKAPLYFLTGINQDQSNDKDIAVKIVDGTIEITRWVEDVRGAKNEQHSRPAIGIKNPTCVKIGSHTKNILVGYENGAILLFNPFQMHVIERFKAPSKLSALSFTDSKDTMFVAKTDDNQVLYWNIKESNPIITLQKTEYRKDYYNFDSSTAIRSHASKSRYGSFFDGDKIYKLPMLWMSPDGNKAMSLPHALFVYALSQTALNEITDLNQKTTLLNALQKCPLINAFEPATTKAFNEYLKLQLAEKK